MLALVSLIIFFVLRIIPGDPTSELSGQIGVTDEQLAAAREEMGLDEPLSTQYLDWIAGVVQGDFGVSYFSGSPTTELIADRAWPTIELCIAALAIGLLIAVPLALLSALRPHSGLDKSLGMFASAGLAMPPFWFGVLLIWAFAVQLGWLPSRGYVSVVDDPVENLRHLLLPAVTLGVVISAPVMRFLRASLLEALSSDYIRTAEGKGLRWHQVVVRHALPNSLLPTLHFVGLLVGTLLGGVTVIEWVFGWPGLGSLAVDAVAKRDYVVLQGVVLLAAGVFIVTTWLVDVLSMLLDPRLRTAER
jgi:peptide/nickel transport system permease protein